MTEKINIGIHVNVFPVPSEAFVIEQARALCRFKPVLMVRRKTCPVEGFECYEIPQSFFNWRRKGFALKPGIWAWKDNKSIYGLELIHAHFGPNGVYATPIAKALKVPLVVTFHGFDATVRSGSFFKDFGINGIQYLLGLPNLKRSAIRVIAVSQFIEARLAEMGFSKESITQHYIGVDTSRFMPLAAGDRSLDVVCVARLMAAKGIYELIMAFYKISKIFPESKLRLIGEGPQRKQYQQLVMDLSLTARVIFEGAMSHEQVAGIVRSCAVSVLASKTGKDGWQEAFGLASVEAAAAGLPVVVTNCGGLAETVVDGVTGIVIAQRSVDELVDALTILLTDADLRLRLGSAGRQRVIDKFDLHKQTSKLEDIYLEALSA